MHAGLKKIRAALIFTWVYVGATLYGLFVLPLVGLGKDQTERWRRRQRRVSGAFIQMLDAMRRAGILDFDTRRAPPRAEGPPRLVIANHPTTVDVLAVLSVYREACVLVKLSNWNHPLLRPLFRWCGHVRTSDGSVEDTQRMMQDVQQRLSAGFDVVIFPEGTRSPPGGLEVMHKGAFALALHSGHALEPLLIECDPPVLHRHAPWHAFAAQPARYRVHPLPYTPPRDTTTRKLQREVTALYRRALGLEPGPGEAAEKPQDTDRYPQDSGTMGASDCGER